MLIVSHRRFLTPDAGDRIIEISMPKPEPATASWCCRCEIGWPEGRQVRDASGIDARHALVLAPQMIGADIYTSADHREGRLRAYADDERYGFPVPSSLRNLLVGVDAP